MDKSSLRKILLEKRPALSAEARADSSRLISQRLLEIIPAGKIVAGYCAIRGEVDVAAALEMLARRGHKRCLPATGNEQRATLVFREFIPGTPLIQGEYGIMTPPPEAPVLVPEVVIVPLVAFDAAGHRLGYGAGYYDHALDELRKRNKNLLAIGAAYAMQQVPHIPAEAHDVRLDRVVTETQIWSW